MAKRRARSQIANLTPNQKKSGIDPIYLAADDVRYTVGKLSTKATTLLQIAPRGLLTKLRGPKIAEVLVGAIQDSHSKREKPFGCGPCGKV